MTTRFTELIHESGLGEYEDLLMQISRPSIELLTSQLPVVSGCSKFGGSPDVPRSFQWPKHEFGDYRFIGQINLAEAPRETSLLPDTGLLSFFYAYDEERKFFWREPGYILAYHFATDAGLEPFEPPPSVRLGATCRIELEASRDLPGDEWRERNQLKTGPLDELLDDRCWELRLSIHSSRRWLLGYPFNNALAFDPTPGPEWLSLLGLCSDEEMEWCWHDDNWLATFIESSRLEKADFSNITAEAG